MPDILSAATFLSELERDPLEIVEARREFHAKCVILTHDWVETGVGEAFFRH